jgi:hypothetical protein
LATLRRDPAADNFARAAAMRDLLRLMPESEVPTRAAELIARERILPRALATLVLYAVALGLGWAAVAAWRDDATALGIGAGLCAVIVGLIGRAFHGTWRAARRPDNWLLRAAPEGLYVKFRSFLMHALAPTDPTVVLIPKAAVTSLRAHRTRVWQLEGADRTMQPIDRALLEIDLKGIDLAPLAAALATERGRWIEGRNSRTRYGHNAVRVLETGVLEITWRSPTSAIVPGLDEALRRLGATYRVAPPAETRPTRPTGALGLGYEAQLREHIERGERLAAVSLASRLYGLDTTAAVAKVDELAGRTEGRTTAKT